eukprot:COSAG06_NODE_9616_length_1858_cov_1.478113_1_plen_31_part_10
MLRGYQLKPRFHSEPPATSTEAFTCPVTTTP